MDDQIYGTSLSQSAIQRIQELKGLMNKYPQYHANPDWPYINPLMVATHFSMTSWNSSVPLRLIGSLEGTYAL
jgi:hypothetical protein